MSFSLSVNALLNNELLISAFVSVRISISSSMRNSLASWRVSTGEVKLEIKHAICLPACQSPRCLVEYKLPRAIRFQISVYLNNHEIVKIESLPGIHRNWADVWIDRQQALAQVRGEIVVSHRAHNR
jgi:hypothetical protein